MNANDIGEVDVTTVKCHLWVCPNCEKKNCTGASLIVECEQCKSVFFAIGKDNKDEDFE